MGHADALIGVSKFVADSIVDLGYSRDKTFGVLNALDLTRWNSQDDGGLDSTGWSDSRDRGLRAEFDIADDVPVLACVSRLMPWKGHRELIEALAIVRRSIPEFRLLIVGEPIYNGEAYADELLSLVAEKDLERQIIFTGYRRDVPRIMAASDVYAMPSFEEPFGMVYLEAMAMCKPVIALDNGGAREIIEHEKSGLLSAPRDLNQLAENIVRLISSPGLCHRMGQYGRRRVEEFFTPQRMARETHDVFLETLSQGRAS